MAPKHVLLAVLLGLLGIVPARAGDLAVVYTVFNPVAPPFPFVLFTYDSPGFITTDTTVSAVHLAFINPLNDITAFSSSLIPLTLPISEMKNWMSLRRTRHPRRSDITRRERLNCWGLRQACQEASVPRIQG
jgi:hypothetical protein